MLKYRARSGDTVLAEHLKRTKENNLLNASLLNAKTE